ncbi:MAG: protein kinase [Anaerolineae bacterium]|nr:protein kinase [Anaerolineae bacterium]
MVAEPLQHSTAFGRYEIIEKLGAGGMAAVYKAFDSDLQITVALKILYDHWAGDPLLVKRLRREADIIRTLKHPNIVTLHDSGEINGKHYLAMEYMAGGSLARRFNRPTSVSLKTSARLLEEICAALDYAHRYQIIHRDLKLENILLDDQNRLALSDFGIASLRNGTRLTSTGLVPGTPLMMSPEQAMGSTTLDHRSDLYSLAVMAYLMATGYYPFTGSSPLALMNQHLTMPPPLPSSINPNLPPALDMVLLKGLAKKPDERYNSATVFAEEFREAVEDRKALTTVIQPHAVNPGLPTTQTQIATVLANHEKRPRSLRRPLLIGLLMLLIPVLMIGGVNLLGTAAGSPSPAPSLMPSATPTNRDQVVDLALQGTLSALVASFTPTYTSTTVSPTLTSSPQPSATPSFVSNAVVSGREGANLRPGPHPRFDILINLPQGTLLHLIGRTENGFWLQTELPDGAMGWVFARNIRADIAIRTLPVTWQEAPTAAPPSVSQGVPQPTAVVLTTSVPIVIVGPTQPPAVIIVTATIAAPDVYFYAEAETLLLGECTNLYWGASGADAVYFQGEPTDPYATFAVCPEVDSEYKLGVWQEINQSYQEYVVWVGVQQPESEAAPIEAEMPEEGM